MHAKIAWSEYKQYCVNMEMPVFTSSAVQCSLLGKLAG